MVSLAPVLYILLFLYFWFQQLIDQIIPQNVKFVALTFNIKIIIIMILISALACVIRLFSQNPQPVYVELLVFICDPFILIILFIASLICMIIVISVNNSIDKEINKDEDGQRILLMVVMLCMYGFIAGISTILYQQNIMKLIKKITDSPEGQGMMVKFDKFMELPQVQPMKLLINEVIDKMKLRLFKKSSFSD